MKILGLVTNLIPPPYGILIHYGLILALVAGVFGFGYVKGSDSEQQKVSAADDQTRIAAVAFTHKQAAKLAPIAAQAEKTHDQDIAAQPATEAGISNHLRNERVRSCPAVASAGAGVPAVRPFGDGGSGSPGVDQAGPAAASDAVIDQHIGHDASHYQECYDAFYALRATASAAGADKP